MSTDSVKIWTRFTLISMSSDDGYLVFQPVHNIHIQFSICKKINILLLQLSIYSHTAKKSYQLNTLTQ